jgi:hypothetical protein
MKKNDLGQYIIYLDGIKYIVKTRKGLKELLER